LRVVAVLCLLILVAVWTVAKRFALPVACSELLALGAVMLFCVRHAADHDFIGLRPDVLTVELRRAGRVSRWDFSPRWVRVEPRTADGSLVRLSGHGKTVDVGRFVSPVLRQQLASELRWALRQVSRDARDGSNR
jgi:uncharacterized membrane protein